MLTGENPNPSHTRAMTTYLNTITDHGMNASTFTARVITSTRSDLISAIVGAIGALKGPLHGGAPGPVLQMLQNIQSPKNAEPYLRAQLENGERLMGFGHAIYKVRDPRANVLYDALEALFAENSDRDFYTFAQHVEQTAITLLEEFKPGRRLQTNVEFYTALLLHSLGLHPDLFTPTFAIGRAVGWIAHSLEQRTLDQIIRPGSVYTGHKNGQWIPLEDRHTN
ncbi:MAG: citrate synthase [Candidatus Latescibacterota bacterium]|jgi:citrate synthase